MKHLNGTGLRILLNAKEIIFVSPAHKSIIINKYIPKKYKKEITSTEFKAILDGDKADNYLIIDMRNDYEYRLGHFKNAIPAGTVNFREVPELIKQYGKQAE